MGGHLTCACISLMAARLWQLACGSSLEAVSSRAGTQFVAFYLRQYLELMHHSRPLNRVVILLVDSRTSASLSRRTTQKVESNLSERIGRRNGFQICCLRDIANCSQVISVSTTTTKLWPQSEQAPLIRSLCKHFFSRAHLFFRKAAPLPEGEVH
jgi:hypothetical protein